MYAYLAAHSASVISSLAKNLMHFGVCDIVRFLLDLPLKDGKPWWGESACFLDPFVECLQDASMAGYANLLLVSVIQRATVFV